MDQAPAPQAGFQIRQGARGVHGTGMGAAGAASRPEADTGIATAAGSRGAPRWTVSVAVPEVSAQAATEQVVVQIAVQVTVHFEVERCAPHAVLQVDHTPQQQRSQTLLGKATP